MKLHVLLFGDKPEKQQGVQEIGLSRLISGFSTYRHTFTEIKYQCLRDTCGGESEVPGTILASSG